VNEKRKTDHLWLRLSKRGRLPLGNSSSGFALEGDLKKKQEKVINFEGERPRHNPRGVWKDRESNIN